MSDTNHMTRNTRHKELKQNLSGRKKTSGPTLNLLNSDIKTRTNNTTLVKSSIKLNHNLTRPVVINVLELTNVTYRSSHG